MRLKSHWSTLNCEGKCNAVENTTMCQIILSEFYLVIFFWILLTHPASNTVQSTSKEPALLNATIDIELIKMSLRRANLFPIESIPNEYISLFQNTFLKWTFSQWQSIFVTTAKSCLQSTEILMVNFSGLLAGVRKKIRSDLKSGVNLSDWMPFWTILFLG